MAEIRLLHPYDQFNGSKRLLDELCRCLDSPAYCTFRLAVAFAKSSPLIKLSNRLKDWKGAGKTSQAIIGLSHRGTSQQALQVALTLFDEVYVCLPGSVATFHPKIYVFAGEAKATLYYGSHNLTVGGTETNFEAGIRVRLSLPADEILLNQAFDSLNALLPDAFKATKALDANLLEDLIKKKLVFDEAAPTFRFKKGDKALGPSLFPVVFPKPPAPSPKSVVAKGAPPAAKLSSSIKAKLLVSESFAIQIVPHPNGEVFLSKIAVNQNPAFFGFPFTGKTTPKKGTNGSYPQRSPDPIVHIAVFDSSGAQVIDNPKFALNTVFYKKKGEIRITISPGIIGHVSPYSVLHMRLGDESTDYYFDIFNPGSKRYADLVAACDQVLPSGGKPVARKMGWL